MRAPAKQLELPFTGVRRVLDVGAHGGQMPRRPAVTLFVDENGHASYTNLSHPSNRFLGLTGVAVRLSDVPRLVQEMDDLKLEYCGTVNAVMHVEDIRGASGVFSALRDPARRRAFDRDLHAGMLRWPYTVFSILMDKEALVERHGPLRYDAYHYALEHLIGAYVRWLEGADTIGTVVAEARGKQEDRALSAAFRALWNDGTQYLERDAVQARLTTGTLRICRKPENVTGLQLADLAAYPLFAAMRQQIDPERPLGLYCGRMADALKAHKVHRDGSLIPGQIWLPEVSTFGQ